MKRFYTLFFITFIFFSCKKQDSVNPESNQPESSPSDIAGNIVAKNDRLAFYSIEDYELYVSDSSKKAHLISATNSADSYVSMSRYASDASLRKAVSGRFQSSSEIVDSLYPEFLSHILNPDGIVQIEDYIIKVDMSNERVLVLNSTDSLFYNDLVTNNLNNEKIKLFSTDEDVLDQLANNQSSQRVNGLFCKDNGINKIIDEGYVYFGAGYRLDCKVVYQPSGIYFSLQSKVKKQYQGWTGIWTGQNGNLQIKYFCVYKAKCKSQVGPYDGWTNSTVNNELNYRPYESTRGLNKAWFRVQFYDHSSGVVTRGFEVRRGY